MDIRSLQMFAHLAKHLHFGETAKQFHLSPSTLSRHIQRLEEELNASLFTRDNRSVAITSAGNALLAFAEQQIEQYQLLKLSLASQQAQLTGKLKIYCSVTAAYSHLPALLEKFRQEHPLVEIVLTTGDAADAIHQVTNKQVDFAIAAKPDHTIDRLHFHAIADIPLTVIAPTIPCHVQQQLAATSIDWSKIPMILPEHGPARKRFEHWFKREHQGKANIYATVSGHEALVSMVALGCGVGVAPQVVVDNSPVKDKVYSLKNAGDIAPFKLGICCLNNHLKQPLVDAFFNAIKD